MGLALAVTLACALNCSTAAALQAPPGTPDLSTISSAERQMIESTCHLDRQKSDPAAYYRCVRDQVDALHASQGSPDLSAISGAERQMIESACHLDRQISGPAAYYRCLREQADALHASEGSPDLSTISSAERQRVESACHLDGQMSGPAAYYRCLRRQVDALADHSSLPSEPQTTGKTASRPQGSSSPQSERHSGDLIVPPVAGPAGSPAAVPHSGADSVSTGSSPRRTLAAWLVGLLIVGFLAKIFYGRVNAKKCGNCGKPTKIRGGYCDACVVAMEESERRASEQQAAEERARAEADRYAREQWEIEESRRVSVLAELHRLTGPQFDDLIASLFRRDGYTVRHGSGNGDEGIDLILWMGQEKDVVQCRPSKSDIELPVVREFYGVLMHAAARHGFIITTASFSQSTRDFARGKPISLISAAEILRWMNGAYSTREQGLSKRSTNTNNDSRAFDPYAVLGISRNASPEEIRAAYRREIVNYHPDKVAHLGKDIRELAQTKAQEINRAYEELLPSR